GVGDPGGDAGDPADRRPGEARQQQTPQRLAPEQGVPLALQLVGPGLQLGDLLLGGAALDGLLDGGLGAAVVDLGVPLAVGDLLQVAVDVAGVGLGLGAGGDLLARVLDQVVAALRAEALLVG